MQSKVLKMIVQGEPRTTNIQMRNELNLEEIEEIINKCTSNFYKQQIEGIDIFNDIGTLRKDCTRLNHTNYS